MLKLDVTFNYSNKMVKIQNYKNYKNYKITNKKI
jgi:hypothetical protein